MFTRSLGSSGTLTHSLANGHFVVFDIPDTTNQTTRFCRNLDHDPMGPAPTTQLPWCTNVLAARTGPQQFDSQRDDISDNLDTDMRKRSLLVSISLAVLGSLAGCSDGDSNTCPSSTTTDGGCPVCDANCPSTDSSSPWDATPQDAVPTDATQDAADASDVVDGNAVDSGPDACTPPSVPADLMHAWSTARPYLRTYVTGGLQGQNPYVMYNLQLWTNNLLMYAEHTQNHELLEQLALLELIPFSFLVNHTDYLFYYAKDNAGHVKSRIQLPLPNPARFWTFKPTSGFTIGPESLLVSSQFLYMVSRTLRVTAQMPSEARGTVLDELTSVAPSVIVNDHYMRWIHSESGEPGPFQVRGWGCNEGTFDAQHFLDHKLHERLGTNYFGGSFSPHNYCNAVTDTDLWIMAGVLEVLAANKADPTVMPLTHEQVSTFTAFVDTAIELINARLTPSHPKDDQGTSTDGFNFDLGSWDDYPDYRYAGYTGDTFPGWTDPNDPTPAIPPKPTTNVGWDISHARRWIRVFDTLRRFHHLSSTPIDADAVTRGLANQFAWGVWNHDGVEPKFTNFMDGTNGWYRVNYSNRPGFGYAPYGLTNNAVTSGYGMWCELVPKMCSTSLRPWYDKAKPTWNLDKATDALREVMSAPTFEGYGLKPNGCGW